MSQEPLPNKIKGFFDLDVGARRPDQTLYRSPTLMRTTEWGGLTLVSLLLASLFPPYFVQVLTIAFLNAGGLLWVTHLSEKGRQRLVEFEHEFRKGYAMEEAGDAGAAMAFYASLIGRFQDSPAIAEIARRRIMQLEEAAGPGKLKLSPRRKRSPKPRARRSRS